MIIKTQDTFLKVKTVYAINVYSDHRTKVVPQGLFKTPKEEKTESFKLIMKYLSDPEEQISYNSWTCPTREPLILLKEEIEKQVKAQDHQWVDEQFEKALTRSDENG